MKGLILLGWGAGVVGLVDNAARSASSRTLNNKSLTREPVVTSPADIQGVRIGLQNPAVGSGAFLVGMMLEIVKARLTLADVEGMPARKAYELKRHAIENSLYGVDFDPGAIEIARLRLWLSLVVDEVEFQQIQPLPNLDYKIMQGNSLLEEFEGVKLIEDSLIMEAFQDNEAQIAELNKSINQLERDAVVVGSKEGKRSPAFLKLQIDLGQLKKRRDALYLQDDNAQSQMGLLDSSKKLGEKLGELEKLRQSYLDYHSISEKKNKLRGQIESKEWEIVEQILTDQGNRDALKELAKHRRDNQKNFFLWKFYFSQVFREKGGFDVVLANPPYVRQEEIKELKPALKRSYRAFTGTADLYVYFYERAINLLNDAGVVAFITSNKYFRAGYGEKLRRLLAENTRIHQVIDFGDAPVFEATAYASSIIMERKFDEAGQPRVWSLPPLSQASEASAATSPYPQRRLNVGSASIKPHRANTGRPDFNHPPTAVGGIRVNRSRLCRLDLNHPPTAVGGIAERKSNWTKSSSKC